MSAACGTISSRGGSRLQVGVASWPTLDADNWSLGGSSVLGHCEVGVARLVVDGLSNKGDRPVHLGAHRR